MSQVKVQLIDKLASAHEGEWLAIEVLDRDENDFPKKGRLVARANSRLELRERIEGRKDIYIKYAGSITPAEYGFLY